MLITAQKLITTNAIHIDVDAEKEQLFIDCLVEGSRGTGRAVIEDEHTRLTRLERDGRQLPLPESLSASLSCRSSSSVQSDLAELSFEELIHLARSCNDSDRSRLHQGINMNMAIARHGLSLFPKRFLSLDTRDSLSGISRLVCAGVYARMCGEDYSVMSLAGSGNKGIVCSLPLALWGKILGSDASEIEVALALACLITSSTTHHLGTLSAVCGCSNAAGIGLAAGLTLLEGGDSEAISMSVNNMVGNVTGMICDGAKIGCALKTMTSVDAAFRAASLALSGIGIPDTDGIVGKNGLESLLQLGRIANQGMRLTDQEILRIMQEKMDRTQAG